MTMVTVMNMSMKMTLTMTITARIRLGMSDRADRDSTHTISTNHKNTEIGHTMRSTCKTHTHTHTHNKHTKNELSRTDRNKDT